MAKTVQGVRGMNDVLPADAHRWAFFEDTVKGWVRSYGYQAIRMPILERTELFVRSIGEVTDIVEKEMYTFTDELNGEQLTRARCSVMSARRRGATGSSIRSASRRWVLPVPTSMPSTS
jgi:hypothetical protein